MEVRTKKTEGSTWSFALFAKEGREKRMRMRSYEHINQLSFPREKEGRSFAKTVLFRAFDTPPPPPPSNLPPSLLGPLLVS